MIRHFDLLTRRYVGAHIVKVPVCNVISQIKAKKNQPKPSDPVVIELVNSIRRIGQKVPILVRRHKRDAFYVVLKGEEMLAALKLMKKIWVKVVVMAPSSRRVKAYEFKNLEGLYRETGAATPPDPGRVSV